MTSPAAETTARSGWTLLNVLSAISLGTVLAFVAYTNLKGWKALVKVEEVRTECTSPTSCVKKVRLNRFGFELAFPADTPINQGDVLNASFECDWGKCRLSAATVFGDTRVAERSPGGGHD